MKRLLLNIFLIGVSAQLFSQNVAINDDGSAPDNSAMLDITSTSRGLLIPRMTQFEKNAIIQPATGLLIYQTDVDSGFHYNQGTPASPDWVQLVSALNATPNIEEVLQSGDDANGENLFGVARLAIGIATTTNEVQINNPSSNGSYLQITESSFGTGVSDGFRLGLDNGAANLINGENSDLRFFTNNIERMRLDASGRLGIGTTAPDSLLDVVGGARIDTLNINSAFTFPSSDGTFSQTLVTDGLGNLSWADNGDHLGNHIATQNIQLNGNYLSNDGDNEGFFIDNAGRVAIGMNNNIGKFSVVDAVDPIFRITSSTDLTESNLLNSAVLELIENNPADFETGAFGFQIRYVGDANERLQFRSSAGTLRGVVMTLMRDTRRVGVGTDAPSSTFHVVHTDDSTDGLSITNEFDNDRWHFFVRPSSSSDLELYFNNNLRGSFSRSTGVYTQLSDSRAKKNVESVDGISEKLSRLDLKTYHYLDQDENSPLEYGFLAQEVLKEFPSLVQKTSTFYTVNYGAMGALAIGAIKEQQLIIEGLKERIDQLEKLLNE